VQSRRLVLGWAVIVAPRLPPPPSSTVTAELGGEGAGRVRQRLSATAASCDLVRCSD
jgi:hypothetical protein